MTWKEIREKEKDLKESGWSEEDVVNILKDDIDAFAKSCLDNPGKMVEIMPEIGEAIKNNTVLFTLFNGLFWKRK